MKRLLACATLLSLLLLAGAPRAADKDEELTPKAALQALNEYIGEWNGTGTPEKKNPTGKDLWTEKHVWSWRFKGDDAWLQLEIKDGKFYKGGEMRYLPDKKLYQLTLTDKDGKKQVFEGEVKNETLTLERTDPATKEGQQIKMNTTNEGVRFNFFYARKPSGRTQFFKEYAVAGNKEGESLAAKEKKNECVVSGGLGTMTVSYKGQTYYVCCSGCRDAFNENPEKYIKEFEAKKKKK
jgi:hypothetical protein